ncbi:PRC-barrel domain-containing protein [uncultured Sulfitobacter sp.]|uniref:PRC-barrel domain-containing protein n=1 Tax=uncultured Sulfitobacter sp. TaxID=191468 RepID=UPI002615E77A|nr:PRC-barrel domain-containing protein [uncultured Sulfitobacter sp.]
MKTLLAASALMISLGGAVAAQSMQTQVGVVKMSEASLLVRDMIGEPVYNFRGRPNTDTPMALAGANRFERIARIKDVMINTDGTVEAIVMSVGGFWGLADREVTADMDGLSVVTDVRGDKYFVIYTYEETLDDARRFNKFDIE